MSYPAGEYVWEECSSWRPVSTCSRPPCGQWRGWPGCRPGTGSASCPRQTRCTAAGPEEVVCLRRSIPQRQTACCGDLPQSWAPPVTPCGSCRWPRRRCRTMILHLLPRSITGPYLMFFLIVIRRDSGAQFPITRVSVKVCRQVNNNKKVPFVEIPSLYFPT